MCQRRAHPARLNAHGRPWPVAACKALVITSSAGPYMGTLRIRPRPTNGGGRARCCAAQSRGWSPNGLDAFDHCGNIAHFKRKGAPPGRRLQGRRCCPNHRAKRGLVTVILLDQTGDVLGDSTVRCVAPVTILNLSRGHKLLHPTTVPSPSARLPSHAPRTLLICVWCWRGGSVTPRPFPQGHGSDTPTYKKRFPSRAQRREKVAPSANAVKAASHLLIGWILCGAAGWARGRLGGWAGWGVGAPGGVWRGR